MKNLISAIFVSFLALVVSVPEATSEYIVNQLTDNPYDDLNGNMNANGQVVWQGHDGTDAEIFLYDGTNTTQLTDNSHNDVSPEINANGYVVWQGSDGSDTEIFLYDGTSVTQLTDNDYNDRDPYISDNGSVFWEGYVGEADAEIFLAIPGAPAWAAATRAERSISRAGFVQGSGIFNPLAGLVLAVGIIFFLRATHRKN